MQQQARSEITQEANDRLTELGRLGLWPAGVAALFRSGAGAGDDGPGTNAADARMRLRTNLLRGEGNTPEFREALAQLCQNCLAEHQDDEAQHVADELLERSTAAADAADRARGLGLAGRAALHRGLARAEREQFTEAESIFHRAERCFAELGDPSLRWMAFRMRSRVIAQATAERRQQTVAAAAPAEQRAPSRTPAVQGPHFLRRMAGALQSFVPALFARS